MHVGQYSKGYKAWVEHFMLTRQLTAEDTEECHTEDAQRDSSTASISFGQLPVCFLSPPGANRMHTSPHIVSRRGKDTQPIHLENPSVRLCVHFSVTSVVNRAEYVRNGQETCLLFRSALSKPLLG